MRMKHSLAVSATVGLILLASQVLVWAQPPSGSHVQSQDTVLESIRAAIAQAIGVRGDTVEVSIAGNILRVSRMDSSMNQTGHAARNSEAARIGPVVSSAISGKPEFKKIHTIRIQYLARSKPGAKEKAVDTVDFRKDPSGAFQFHAS